MGDRDSRVVRNPELPRGGDSEHPPDQAASASTLSSPHAVRPRVDDTPETESHSPNPPFPSHRLVLVVDNGGGGFSICEAVGARDWRIEYVRCMIRLSGEVIEPA